MKKLIHAMMALCVVACVMLAAGCDEDEVKVHREERHTTVQQQEVVVP
jgi:hypothetical protein